MIETRALRRLVSAALAIAVVGGPVTVAAAVPYGTQQEMFSAIRRQTDPNERCRGYAKLEKATDGFGALDPKIATAMFQAVTAYPGGHHGLSQKVNAFADAHEYGKACDGLYMMALGLEHVGKHKLVVDTMLPALHDVGRYVPAASTPAAAANPNAGVPASVVAGLLRKYKCYTFGFHGLQMSSIGFMALTSPPTYTQTAPGGNAPTVSGRYRASRTRMDRTTPSWSSRAASSPGTTRTRTKRRTATTQSCGPRMNRNRSGTRAIRRAITIPDGVRTAAQQRRRLHKFPYSWKLQCATSYHGWLRPARGRRNLGSCTIRQPV